MENTQRSLNETSFLDSYSWHHFILFLEEIDEELTIILIASLWFQYTSFEIKIKSILCACFFSVLEFFFYGMTEWGPNDEVLFTPGKFSLDRCHTTWEMFWTNIAYMPILLSVYQHFIPSKILQVILFPLNVWIAEIVIGSYLFQFWERRAWVYKGEDAYFDGLIKLYYFPLWILLGLVYVLANHLQERSKS